MKNDVSAARVYVVQVSLFPPSTREVCARIGLKLLAAVRLHEAGWLSFDPQKIEKLEEDKEAELVFVGSLVAGGCDDAILKQLLAGLEKPYRYRTHQMCYDWGGKTWRLLPVQTSTETDVMFVDWIDELVRHREIDKIMELKKDILLAETICNKLLKIIDK